MADPEGGLRHEQPPSCLKVDIDKGPHASVDPLEYDAILALVIASKCPYDCK